MRKKKVENDYPRAYLPRALSETNNDNGLQAHHRISN